MDKDGHDRPDNQGRATHAMGEGAWRWFHDTHNFWLIAALVYAVAHLAVFRNGDLRPVLLFLVPPLFAFGTLASPKATPPARFAAKLFLGLVTLAIILAEQPFILQNMKPQFPGVPNTQDRILTFYTGAYLLFIMGILPGFACGVSLYRHARGEHATLAKPICYLGLGTWLLLMVGMIGGIPVAIKALF
jgi:hypothetical protein